jgi:hypothetical protein
VLSRTGGAPTLAVGRADILSGVRDRQEARYAMGNGRFRGRC